MLRFFKLISGASSLGFVTLGMVIPPLGHAEQLVLKTPLVDEFDQPVTFTVTPSPTKLAFKTKDDDVVWERTEDFSNWQTVSNAKTFHVSVKKSKRAIFYRLSRSGPRVPKLYVPKDYDPEKKYPFVLSLHGYTGNSSMQDKFFPLKDWAEKYDFIFCTPDGRKDQFGNRGWAEGDSEYLRGLIDASIEQYSIGTKRVYSSGHSNGAIYSYKMALDHSDIMTAIVPIAGIGFNAWEVDTENPVSVLHIHGTIDNIVWWGGDRFRGIYPGVLEYIDRWKENNDCTKRKPVERIDMRSQLFGKETEITRYENKNGSVVTDLWKVNFTGHFPSPNRPSMERIVKWMLDKKRE